ncbi:MAG TPA: DNA-directed RNA polymerase subunit beta [Candidatus Hydrothermia bacterium]|nr:DNA-directed RNA polymerase subunit beta [Candidatus Hydrothermae bacterium]HOK23158.1 DNA-directed RNA polymerase subunit beta [Candidatus Hydrothermia bacterium]HOL23862.1 DNA-directed RNA polymerase subunit beta [Candidatus Hydrothermia bacterium]HOP31881.1 DNA-directed RNA polymerase subunit beta [Candidatus Hydrothermia bacterium]HPO78867.1 DNA-directed RNA polymerase subunit beta [Candidatus Hydrothermia bacterium]
MDKIIRKGYKPEKGEMPNLLFIQLDSFRRLLSEGVGREARPIGSLEYIFREYFPVTDKNNVYKLEYLDYTTGVPRFNPEECKEKSLTYSVPLKVRFRLLKKNPETKEFEESVTQEVYMGEIPYMTDSGTFVINGVERVLVSQIHRSPGVYFEIEEKGTVTYRALLVPYRGPWVEFNIDGNRNLTVTVSKRRKIPVTRLLRALTGMSMSQVFGMFLQKRSLTLDELDENGDYIITDDVVDTKTGEVIFEALTEIDSSIIKELKERKIRKIEVFDLNTLEASILYTTYRQDRLKKEVDAIGNIYRTLKFSQPPANIEEAREYIRSFFLKETYFYLADVGRYKLNLRLYQNQKRTATTLTIEDIVEIIKRLIDLYKGEEKEDDVDDLSNRRIRSVGELLYEQVREAFARKLIRNITEKMLSISEESRIVPKNLIDPKVITNTLINYLMRERLSQFLDQTNPLSELTHKRRISALGKGGLTRETAGFEVRDVHPSHYGRLCPIETPEGQNIGLISSLTTYAKVDEMGFIRTPLRVVEDGRVTEKTVDLSPIDEKDAYIASADTEYDPVTGLIKDEKVWVRAKDGYPMVPREKVNYIDISPRQVVSPSASLIPFLENDDALRALMGCNMQRQAIPLIDPEPPIIGTGMEGKVARDSGTLVIARNSGTVVYVDANRIVVRVSKKRKKISRFEEELDEYNLVKFRRSNQNTLINMRPLVKIGEKVKAGDVLADASATKNGELALGKNVLIAFLPWYGYNYEDAIVVSENILKNDTFTSLHILEFEVEVRETALGPEEVTVDIPGVKDDDLRNLDHFGIIRIGAEVKPRDILVGKVTPKGEEEELPPEKKLLLTVAGYEQEVKDTSKRVPPGVSGYVVDVVVLTKTKNDPLSLSVIKDRKEKAEKRAQEEKRMMRARLRDFIAELLLDEVLIEDLKTRDGKVVLPKGTVISRDIIDELIFENKIDLERLNYDVPVIELEKLERIRGLIADSQNKEREINERLSIKFDEIERGDELPPGVNQLIKVYVAQKRRLEVGDKITGRHGNKGVVAKIAPVEDMPFLEDGTPVDVVLSPLGVPSRMNVGQILETILGWAGKVKGEYYATPVFEGMSVEDIKKEMEEAGLTFPGKVKLRDGRTGEEFHYPVTVGYMYIIKLIHMVEDKLHARAIGPYSSITQQPVGGKSHFGGQRFGEMEVWALQAHGAAYTLQEMLTIKSDDIDGRNILYKDLQLGKRPKEPGIPASFNVLLNHLKGLCLDVELKTVEGKSRQNLREKQ